MTEFWRGCSPRVRIRACYLVAGLVTGALWVAQHGSPLEHAVRLLALMAVVMTVSRAVRWWADRRGRRLPEHPIGRFLVAKVALVVVALAAAVTLDGVVAHADQWVAVGIGIAVAMAGPLLHPWLMKHGETPAELATGAAR
jgi:low temperature requirement protein LtrA